MHALHYANELLVRVRLSFQKLLQNRSTYRHNTKCLGKEYSLSIRVQTTINHISIFTFLCFIRQHQRQRKCFLSERELKKALHDTLTRAAWFEFDWFLLSMGMQVILDSSFVRPGSAPMGRKERRVQGLDYTTDRQSLFPTIKFRFLLCALSFVCVLVLRTNYAVTTGEGVYITRFRVRGTSVNKLD